jgi:hypothetical protein
MEWQQAHYKTENNGMEDIGKVLPVHTVKALVASHWSASCPISSIKDPQHPF